MMSAGPALASPGPDLKHLCGAHAVVCRNCFEGASRRNDRNRRCCKGEARKGDPRPLQRRLQWTAPLNPSNRIITTSGVRRQFPRGGKFRHNRVTSQINFRGSAEGTTILGGPGACPRENLAKLHLKIRIFVHSGSKF